MKRCPICGLEKDVSEFDRYFSKERNKWRVGNYCKECRRKNSLIRAKEYYENNDAVCKEKAKLYRQKNAEKIRLSRQKFKTRQIEQLQNCYVAEELARRLKSSIKEVQEVPGLIDAYRAKLKLSRKIKILKNEK